MKQKISHFFIFLFFFLLVFFVQLVGALATSETIYTWYRLLRLPEWTPPNWIFGPVWTILYVTIALSGYLFWRARSSKNRSYALIFWGVQLFLNGSWSFAFFYFMSPFLGSIDITLLIVSVALLFYYGYKVSRLGAYLLVPYFLWLLFAAGLNWTIYFLNY